MEVQILDIKITPPPYGERILLLRRSGITIRPHETISIGVFLKTDIRGNHYVLESNDALDLIVIDGFTHWIDIKCVDIPEQEPNEIA